MSLWELVGMDFVSFSHLSIKERLAINRRFNGVKIMSCCQRQELKERMKNPMRNLLNSWFEDNAEKATIKYKYPHAVIK